MRRPVSALIFSAALLAACGGSDSAAPAASSPDPDSATTDATAPGVSEPEPPSTDSGTTEPATTEPATTEPATTETAALDPLPSIGLGEYAVGVQTITITDVARNRPLTVDVWFPLADETAGDPHRYTFVTGDYYESPFAVDAAPTSLSTDGPFPLVVYTHGSGGLRYIHSNYTEFLASHGYVVVAPDHTGNTAIDQFTETEVDRSLTLLNRPQDVRAVIDAMLDPQSSETADFVSSVDPEQIAVTGHSLGGFTTYAAVSGYDNELGSVEPDPRVDAIIPIAPAVGGSDPADQLLSDARLESVGVPALVMVGTNDQTTPLDPNVTRAWELTASEPHYRVELVDAAHQTFTDVCAYQESFPSLPNVNPAVVQVIDEFAVAGCSVGDMPIPRAQDITNSFAVAFLDSVFDDTTMFEPDAFTIPDDVNFMAK
jgi:predicted dienelactone hydrolase